MEIMKPWSNIVTTAEENRFSISVWGRTYLFENSFLPSAIFSAGYNLLYEPALLHLTIDGEERSIHHFSYEVVQQSGEKVIVICSALCGNLIINADVEIEYDGYMQLAIRLMPCGEFNYINAWERESDKKTGGCLEKAWIDWKFTKETASLFHFWPNGESGVRVLGLANSGKFSERVMPFKPCIWIGNEECGLNICMEKDEALLLNGAPFLEMTEETDFNRIRMNLLEAIPKEWENQEEKWLHNLPPVTFEFLLQATPVKPWNEELFQSFRAYHTEFHEINIESLAKDGFKWLILHENWSRIQNYCLAADRKLLEDIIKRCHDNGIKVMAYFGYEYSSAVPGFHKHMENYLNRTKDGYYTGGWSREGQYQKAYIACYQGGYSEEMIACCQKAMEEYNIDGIYTDGTYVPWECANERHGCGYRDEQGELHMTWPIRAVREHVKKLYKMVHERGGIIDTHQSSCCLMPTLSFCDTYFDGENIQSNIRENMENFLSMDMFRCEFMGRNFGIIPNLIAYVDEESYRMRNLLAISLPHNVLPRPMAPFAIADIKMVWKTYDDFGISNAEWKPYWKRNSTVTCMDNDVYISTFEKEDRILAAVSCFSVQKKSVTLYLPKKNMRIYEVFDNKWYSVKDGKVIFSPDISMAYLFVIFEDTTAYKK